MVNLSVDLCGKKLKNPVIPASGTFGFGREFDELYDISVLGGVATKGLTLAPRLGTPFPALRRATERFSTPWDCKTPAWTRS